MRLAARVARVLVDCVAECAAWRVAIAFNARRAAGKPSGRVDGAVTRSLKFYSMIPKRGNRFSEKIMLIK
jgi:hypothetical protein